MARSMRFCCPNCQVRIKGSWQLRGKTRNCPKCEKPFVVDPEFPEDAGPVLVQEAFASEPQAVPA